VSDTTERQAEDGAMLVNILLWCLFGLIAGAIAQFILPDKAVGSTGSLKGIAITIVLGILGALVGGFISSQLFSRDVTGFNLSSFVIAILGALLLLVLYRMVTSGRKPF
jgi:uncharacterized membrane protein YeaQ/YmgE (transglycosylase-associated protein family)